MTKDAAQHDPDLAAALTDHAAALREVGGRTAEALEAIEEAVTICRRLVKHNPGRCDPELARALIGRSAALAEGGGRTAETFGAIDRETHTKSCPPAER